MSKLTERLRGLGQMFGVAIEAADALDALTKERDALQSERDSLSREWGKASVRAEAAESRLSALERQEEEIARLRIVYEEARRFLRNNGIDQEKSIAAVDALETAIDRVMLLDGGNDDSITAAPPATEAKPVTLEPYIQPGDEGINGFFINVRNLKGDPTSIDWFPTEPEAQASIESYRSASCRGEAKE